MIRRAAQEDIPALIALFEQKHREMGCTWSINIATLAQTFSHAIVSPDWLCLTGDGCLLLAASFESPVGAGKLAQELCFCASRGNFDELIKQYEEWARKKGCREASLACERRHQTFTRLYGRYGYAVSETTFSKVL